MATIEQNLNTIRTNPNGENVREAIAEVIQQATGSKDAKTLGGVPASAYATAAQRIELEGKIGSTLEILNLIEAGTYANMYTLAKSLHLPNDANDRENNRHTITIKNSIKQWDELNINNFFIIFLSSGANTSGATISKTYEINGSSGGTLTLSWDSKLTDVTIKVICYCPSHQNLCYNPTQLTVKENNTNYQVDLDNKICYGPVIVEIPTTTKTITSNGTYNISSETPPAEGEYAGYTEVEVNVPQDQPTLQAKTATVNNTTYTADQGYDGLSSVTVQVPVPAPSLGTKNITSNDIYYAQDDNLDGYSAVAVAVPQQTLGTATVTATADTTYVASDYDLDGFSQFTVNVRPPLQSKTVTTNQTVTPDNGYYGLSSVVVNVSGGGGNPITLYSLEELFWHFDLDELPSKWNLFNLNSVTNFYKAFAKLPNISKNLDLTGMPHGTITNARYMFQGCQLKGIITIPANFITASADVYYFAGDMNSNQSGYNFIIDGSNIFSGNAYSMFRDSYRHVKFQNGIPDFSRVTGAEYMFSNTYLDEIEDDLSDVDFSSVTNAQYMFAENLVTDPFALSVELPAVTNINRLASGVRTTKLTFKDCIFGSSSHTLTGEYLVSGSYVTEIVFDNTTINRPTALTNLFRDATNVTKVDMSGLSIVTLSTSELTNINRWFNNMQKLKTIIFPLSFDTTRITNYECLFDSALVLKEVAFPNYLDTSGATNMYYLFQNAMRHGGFIFLPSTFTASGVTNNSQKPFNYNRDTHLNPVHVFTPAASGDQSLGTINSGFIMHYGVTRAQYEAMNSIDRTPASGATPLQGANISDFTIQGMQSGAAITYDLSTNTATLIGRNSNNSRIYKLISGFESGKKYEISFTFACDQEMSGGSNGDGVEVGFKTTEPTSGSSITDGTWYKYWTGDDFKLNVPITATATDLYIYVQFRQLNSNEHTITFENFKVIEIVDEDDWTIS